MCEGLKKNIVMVVKRVEKPIIPIHLKEYDKIIEDDYTEYIIENNDDLPKSEEVIIKRRIIHRKKRNKKKSEIVFLSLSSMISWISSLPSGLDGFSVLYNPFFLGFLLFSLFLLNNLKR